MRGGVIGKIVVSKSAKYPKETYVYAPSGWTELAVFDDGNKDIIKVELPKEGRLTDALGVLG
jgi:NADPH-dependent curcumin reductase CurA